VKQRTGSFRVVGGVVGICPLSLKVFCGLGEDRVSGGVLFKVLQAIAGLKVRAVSVFSG